MDCGRKIYRMIYFIYAIMNKSIIVDAILYIWKSGKRKFLKEINQLCTFTNATTEMRAT